MAEDVWLSAPTSASAALEELEEILEHELSGPMAMAMNRMGSISGSPRPHWRQVSLKLDRASYLAAWLRFNA